MSGRRCAVASGQPLGQLPNTRVCARIRSPKKAAHGLRLSLARFTANFRKLKADTLTLEHLLVKLALLGKTGKMA
jgi:hypothetical protein